MKREYYGFVLMGTLFMYLLFNFFTEEYSWYRNVLLSLCIAMGVSQAVIYHLAKNGKL